MIKLGLTKIIPLLALLFITAHTSTVKDYAADVGAGKKSQNFDIGVKMKYIGAGFQTVETPGGLSQALEEHQRKNLILIDTPGYSPGEMELALDLAAFITTQPGVDTHLVLSCTTNSTDLISMAERYSMFRPAKLAFTRLDETEAYGTILNEAARTRLPISFLSKGQRIPEDLEPATKGGILDLVLGAGRVGAAKAATGR